MSSDPYLVALNALTQPTSTAPIYIDRTDYEGMRLANEKAEQATKALEEAQQKSKVEAERAWWKPRLDAAEGQVIHSDLNYRAWRAVAEAVEGGLAGALGRPIDPVAPTLILRHVQTLIAARQAIPGQDRDTLKQLAQVERWRLLGLMMDERMDILPEDQNEGGLNYYKFSAQLHNGTAGKEIGDVVFYMEDQRRPGMIVNITQTGLRALSALDKKGLAPPGIWEAIRHVVSKKEALYEELKAFREREAQSAQRKIDELNRQLDLLKARLEALESAHKEQTRHGPGWFGKKAWTEALGKTTTELAQVKESIAACNRDVKALTEERDLALSRGRWLAKQQKYDIAHTLALVEIDAAIRENPRFMDQFAGQTAGARNEVVGAAHGPTAVQPAG